MRRAPPAKPQRRPPFSSSPGMQGPIRMFLMFNIGVFGGACCFFVNNPFDTVVGMSGGCYSLIGSLSTVLEAPIPKMSLGDKTSLHVINIYSDKQQLFYKSRDHTRETGGRASARARCSLRLLQTIISLSLYIYIYIHIRTHIYIYIYIYIDIHT